MNRASLRRHKLMVYVRATDQLPLGHLLSVVGQPEYGPLIRAAVLRNLVSAAPKEITRGRLYPEQRRIVRAHYRV